MRTRLTVAASATVLLALTACSSGGGSSSPADPTKLDDSAQRACDDFTRGIDSAQTVDAQQQLTRKVIKSAQKSHTKGIATQAKVIADAMAGDAVAWETNADAFTQICLDAGWKP